MNKVVQASAFILLLLVIGVVAFGSSATGSSPGVASSKVLIDQDMPASKHLKSIVLGAGCFWGAEKRYAAIPGVVDAVSGYADGSGLEPSYREITKSKHRLNPNNYAEVVKVTYNDSVVGLDTILKSYFEGHDPTQVNRQGNDIGTQYRSTILTSDDAQREIADEILAEYQVLLSKAGYGKIATKVKALEAFYPAEEYHQDYLVKNPNGYCPDHSTGVVFDPAAAPQVLADNSALKQGRHIVVIEAKDFCPYCEKFKANVLNDYEGSIPVTFRLASQLQGLSIVTPTWATPTILVLENGKEIFGRQGYMGREEFYAAIDGLAD